MVEMTVYSRSVIVYFKYAKITNIVKNNVKTNILNIGETFDEVLNICTK